MIRRVDCCSLSSMQKSSRDVGRHNPKHRPHSTPSLSLHSRICLPSAPPPVRAETMSPRSLRVFVFFLSLFSVKRYFFKAPSVNPPLPFLDRCAGGKKAEPAKKKAKVAGGKAKPKPKPKAGAKGGGKKKKKVRVLGVIPARYGSTRFPAKPLALIGGKPMIWQGTWRQVASQNQFASHLCITPHPHHA